MLSDTEVDRIATAVADKLMAARKRKKAQWLNGNEAAKYIGVSRSKFYSMRRKGDFEAHDKLYNTDELDLAVGRLPE